ncbi:MAG TPA: PE-PPE domain-containing protein [Mycobacterium sp.]
MSRFDLPPGSNPSIASLGMTFSGATPVTDYPTAIYTGEYDAIADFPRYPLNLLPDLNALLGFLVVHTTYPTLTADQLASAVQVPTSDGYDGAATYYMVPTENLPLLDPVRSIPVVGPVVADLLQPDLRVLVNLGYGDPDYGWMNDDANVPTPLGLFPSLNDLAKVPELLAAGTVAGIQKAISDLASPSQLFSLADNPVLNLVQNPVLDQIASTFLPTGTSSTGVLSIVNAFSGAVSSLYSALLPTADILNALGTSLPAYDISLLLDELAGGNPIDAVGLPIAADFEIVSLARAFRACRGGGGGAVRGRRPGEPVRGRGQSDPVADRVRVVRPARSRWRRSPIPRRR